MSKRLAVLENNIVVNKILAESWPNSLDLSQYEIEPNIGDTYDPENNLFIPAVTPEEPEGPVEKRWITKLAFENRFTVMESAAIRVAAVIDPNADQQTKMQSGIVQVLLDRASKATYIDLDRDDTKQSVNQLEAMNLIGAGRAAVILNSPIEPIEVWKHTTPTD